MQHDVRLAAPDGSHESRVVVFVPGLGNSPAPEAFTSTLLSHGVTVVTVRYDDADASPTTLPALARGVTAQVRAAVKAVPSPPRVVLVGYSLGGMVAEHVFLQGALSSVLEGLVLVSTTCGGEGGDVPIGAPLTLASVFGHRRLTAALSSKSEAWHRRLHAAIEFLGSPEQQDATCTSFVKGTSSAHVPVLVLHGARDELFDVRTFTGDHVTTIVFPKGKHSLLHDSPRAVAHAVLTWWGNIHRA